MLKSWSVCKLWDRLIWKFKNSSLWSWKEHYKRNQQSIYLSNILFESWGCYFYKWWNECMVRITLNVS